MFFKQKILFSEDECKSLVFEKNEEIVNWNKIDRKYQSNAIYFTDETKWIFEKLTMFFEETCDIEIKEIKKEIHFHKFETGDWFDKHDDNKSERLYAVGVLLNDSFEGGDFKIYNPNEFTLDKKIGNTYIFDVRIPHEITKILNGYRYSLLWFLERRNIKFKSNMLI